jgi:hypothetical protein
MALVNGQITTVAFNKQYDSRAEEAYRFLYPSEIETLQDLSYQATKARQADLNEHNLLEMRVREIADMWSQTSVETLRDLQSIDYDIKARPLTVVVKEIVEALTRDHRISYTALTVIAIAVILYILDISR